MALVRHRIVVSAAVTAVGASVAVAALADVARPGATAWSVGVDLAVGIAFPVAAALMTAHGTLRVLVTLVGIAWLLGSFSPELQLSHQTLLCLALLAFPVPLLRNPAHWAVAIAAVLLGWGAVPRPWPALVLLVLAAVCGLRAARGRGRSRWFPTIGAALVAGVLVTTWLWETIAPASFSSALALSLYEVTLIIVALGFWIAARLDVAGRRRAAEAVLHDDGTSGLEGLAAVLADAVDDPTIRIERATRPTTRPPSRSLEVVDERGQLVAVVHHATDALLEPPVASAVSRAIRLALDHERYASGLERQLTTLEDARRRLVGATDRQRELTAARLRTEVVAPLEVARDRVARARTRMQQTDALDALDIVLSELERARDEVLALVAGTPSAQLGGGGLAESLRELSRRGAIPISVSIENGVAADPPAERALFYVATEAVTNALKHAQATAIELVLGRERDTLVLVVSDDGGGDADAEGSGVRGMADRLATQGGRLSILSPPGNGTVVTATIPVRGSSSRA